jgi:hypothetical protein
LVRDLEIELASKSLSVDRAVIQSLGILIGQSQKEGVDKTEYFAALLDTQDKIETSLRDLKGVGIIYHVNLIDALHWLDEVVESGNDLSITNGYLQNLIYDYYIGPDVGLEGSTDSLVQEITSSSPEDAPMELEVPISDRSIAEMERAKLQAARKRAHEVYGTVLSAILAEEEIEFVDIVASAAIPPKALTYRSAKTRQEVRYADIDPNRLLGLISLRNQLREQGKRAELKFIRGAQNQAYPPFVLYVQELGEASGRVCILENPVVGYSSRIYPIPSGSSEDWRHVLTLNHAALSELGVTVRTKIHKPKGSPIFDQHYDLDLLNLITLHLQS